MAKDKKQFQMDPNEYKEFLRQVDLNSILLDSCAVKTDRSKITTGMKLDIKHKTSFSIEKETTGLITSSYALIAFKTAKKDFSVKILCDYCVQLSSGKPMTEEFLEIFAHYNVQMNTWPYFREFVQNMIQKTGLPTLTLPLFKR